MVLNLRSVFLTDFCEVFNTGIVLFQLAVGVAAHVYAWTLGAAEHHVPPAFRVRDVLPLDTYGQDILYKQSGSIFKQRGPISRVIVKFGQRHSVPNAA